MKKLAFSRAIDLYKEFGKETELIQSACAHLIHGHVVVSTPENFMLARMEPDGNGQFNWFVEIGVGKLTNLLRLLGIGTPFISFCRLKGKQHVKRTYPMMRFVQLAKTLESTEGY